MAFSNYLITEILNHILTEYPTIYVGLSLTDPGDDGSALDEPVGDGYSRVGVESTDLSVTGAMITNDEDIVFPMATSAWGTVTHLALFTAATEGEILASQALNTPVDVIENGVVEIETLEIKLMKIYVEITED